MEEQFPEVVGISHYEKSRNHLDKRELHDFGSTNKITFVQYFTKQTVLRYNLHVNSFPVATPWPRVILGKTLIQLSNSIIFYQKLSR